MDPSVVIMLHEPICIKWTILRCDFQTTIGEIQTQMTDNHERNTKLREENADLATKLKNFIEQYELREQVMDFVTTVHLWHVLVHDMFPTATYFNNYPRCSLTGTNLGVTKHPASTYTTNWIGGLSYNKLITTLMYT